MRFAKILFAVSLFLGGVAEALPGYITFPSDVDWVMRSSEHFDTIYRRGNDAFAERAIKAAERAYRLLTPIFPTGPERTWMVLADFSDSTNGYALTFPFPHIVIYASPPDASGTLSSLDHWLDSVILHEYVHILQIFPANGFWKLLHTVFGTIISPNGLMPSHFHEGIAVFMETDKSDGGRGRSTLWRMFRRMAVLDGKWGVDDFAPTDEMDGGVTRFPQGASAYFFGYQFYEDLWARKGAKGIKDVTEDYSSNLPFLFNFPLRNIYNTDVNGIWADIYKKTTVTTKREIEDIRKEPLSKFKQITMSHHSKWDVTLSQDGKKALYRRWNPENGSGIEIVDLEKETVIKTLDLGGSGEGLCWVVGTKDPRLIYVDVESSGRYSLQYLKMYEMEGDKVSTLWKAAHVHRLACSPTADRVLVYQESNGVGYVRKLEVDLNHADKTKLLKEWKMPTGSWVSSFLVGETDWIGLREGMTTSFFRWRGNGNPEKMLEIKGHAYNLRSGKAPNEILAIANLDGRDEIWAFDPEKKQQRKILSLMGGTNSFDVNEKGFVFSNYQHGGYDIAKAVGNSAQWTQARALPPRKLASEPEVKLEPVEEYSAWSSFWPKTWIPSLLFVPDGLQLGFWIPGFDIAQKNIYDIIGGYDSRGLPFADVTYTRRFWKDFTAGAEFFYFPNYIDHRLFAQWGGSATLGVKIPGFPPTLQVSALFKKTESFLTLPALKSVGLQVNLSYGFSFKRRPLSVSPVRGTNLSLNYAKFLKFLGSDEDYFSLIASADQYIENPLIREHVFYLGARAGYTEGSVFYNSYFTSGGDLMFYQARGIFLNRGFVAQQFYGRRVVNLNLEYRFPIATIERGYGLFPAFLKAIHGAVVSDTTTLDTGALSTLPKDLFNIYYTSLGVEMKTDWTFSYYLPTQVKVGAYHGFGPVGQDLYLTAGIEASL